MSVTTSSTLTSATITTVERTRRIVCDAPYKGTYSVTIQRERIITDAGSNQIGSAVHVGTYTIAAASVASQTVTQTVNGQSVTLTVAQLQGFLVAAADLLAAAAEAAAPPPDQGG